MARLQLDVNVNTTGLNKVRDIGRNLTIGVTVPILGAAGAVLNLAREGEESEARLKRAFDSMGADAWTSVEEIEAAVSSLQDKSTFGDEAIRDAAATLLTFGTVADDEFDRALQAAIDMSSFLDKDLQDTIIQVGKAVNDPEKGLASLNRIGVQFTDEQKKVIADLIAIGDTAGAQGIILGELERQMGGAAAAVRDTAGGEMTAALERLGDAGESIGTLLLPVLATVAGYVQGAAEWFLALDEKVKGAILTIAGILAVVGPVLWVGSVVVGMATSIIGSFAGIRNAFNVLRVLLLTNPFVALAAAVVALVALIVLNWDKIVNVFRGALQFIGSVGKRLWEPLGKGFTAAIDVIRGAWNAFARWWNSLKISVPSFDVPFVGRVGGFSIGLPKLPQLAEGGIVNSPTLALIGEAGPEAVVPLSNGMMGEHHTHIHIENHGPPIEEEDDIVDTLRAVVPYIDGRLGPSYG